MKAYYTGAERKKFLYVDLTEEDYLKMGYRRSYNHDHGTQFHLTTDHAFDNYLQKRLQTPAKVVLFSTKIELADAMLLAGFIL